MSGTHALVVWSTFPDPESATRVCRSLVEEGLAACAQRHVSPVISVYRWEGEIHEDNETIVVLKTDAARWDRLVGRLAELHPYDTPQILASEARGSGPYLDWLHRCLDEADRC